jgi:hypothetical protein
MSVVIQLIADYSPWIYALCGMIALWYLREAYLVRRERRQAMYTLEREAAVVRIRSMFGIALVLILMIAAVYTISSYLTEVVEVPTVEEEVASALTPTASVLQSTPTPTDLPPTPVPTVTPTPRPRPTKRPDEPDTPTPPPVQPAACPDARSTITEPGVNSVLSGRVSVMGSAYSDRFNYYKLEFSSGADPNTWHFILQGDSPVGGGLLGAWDTSGLAPGIYNLQLKVVDATGNWVDPPCQVRVTVGQ